MGTLKPPHRIRMARNVNRSNWGWRERKWLCAAPESMHEADRISKPRRFRDRGRLKDTERLRTRNDRKGRKRDVIRGQVRPGQTMRITVRGV